MMLMESDSTTTPRGLVDDWWAGLSLETGLYILIGLLALGVRMVQLGNAPLSAAEAHEALSAWRLVSMSSLPITQPISAAWYSLTSLTFLLLGASDFWARFWPMVAGVALVFTPVIFRRELGQSAALLASLLLALSPTLMAASRTVDGTTLAALGLVVTLAGLRQMGENPTGRGWLVTGLGLGLGLASGPRFVSGVAAGLIALILVVFVRPQVARSLRASWAIVRPQAGLALIASAVIFVVVGSGGLLVPSALSAAGVGLPTWLAGWVKVNDPRPDWLGPPILVAN